MAILIVFPRILRLALVVWLGISALVWAVIFGMIEPFKIFRKETHRIEEKAKPGS